MCDQPMLVSYLAQLVCRVERKDSSSSSIQGIFQAEQPGTTLVIINPADIVSHLLRF